MSGWHGFHLPDRPPAARLYHYTNVESSTQIGEAGDLLPIRQLDSQAFASMPATMQPLFDLVWATDLPVCDRYGLGLTSMSIDVDRTAVRYRVLDTALFVPWGRVRREFNATIRDGLELAVGATPRHWWVSRAGRIPVLRDNQ